MLVLIPVWCNWNRGRTTSVHAPSTVLIPVWCNWNRISVLSRRERMFVLIPVWCNWNTASLQVCWRRRSRFNSCMVQLKYPQRPALMCETWRFNSCMVQLKFQRWNKLFYKFRVLIPVWCNWNRSAELITFRSFCVLIPVWCNWNREAVIPYSPRVRSFNSCMVQLKYLIPYADPFPVCQF